MRFPVIQRIGARVASWSAPRRAVVGFSLLALLALVGWLLVDRRDPPELLLFIGRFHPVIVHFPIGLILLAALLEIAAALHRPWRVLSKATPFVLVLGSLSATGAVVAGYLRSLEGSYDESLLTTHMWLGIGVTAGVVTATVLKLRASGRGRNRLDRAYAGVLFTTAGVLVLAGHQGGSLTHGPGYLTYYLPESIRDRLGVTDAYASRPGITDVDSAYVYQDLIVPIFQARCTSCHAESKPRGGLRLDSPEGLMAGGDGGEVVIAGSPDDSELLHRITLSPRDRKAMPAEGARPLDVGETELIRWWIANGASMQQRVGDAEEIPTAVATLLNRIAPPRAEKRPAVYALAADPPDQGAIEAAKRAGFGVVPVARDLPLLQVTAVNRRGSVDDDELKLLLPLAAQITWLDLTETQVGDGGLQVLAEMPNLTRLNLSRTNIGDDGVRHLAGLEHLEYLNLFGTQVGDAALEHLEVLGRLRSLYLWQTAVSDEGVEQLRRKLPQVRVVLGTTPQSVLTDAASGPQNDSVRP